MNDLVVTTAPKPGIGVANGTIGIIAEVAKLGSFTTLYCVAFPQMKGLLKLGSCKVTMPTNPDMGILAATALKGTGAYYKENELSPYAGALPWDPHTVGLAPTQPAAPAAPPQPPQQTPPPAPPPPAPDPVAAKADSGLGTLGDTHTQKTTPSFKWHAPQPKLSPWFAQPGGGKSGSFGPPASKLPQTLGFLPDGSGAIVLGGPYYISGPPKNPNLHAEVNIIAFESATNTATIALPGGFQQKIHVKFLTQVTPEWKKPVFTNDNQKKSVGDIIWWHANSFGDKSEAYKIADIISHIDVVVEAPNGELKNVDPTQFMASAPWMPADSPFQFDQKVWVKLPGSPANGKQVQVLKGAIHLATQGPSLSTIAQGSSEKIVYQASDLSATAPAFNEGGLTLWQGDSIWVNAPGLPHHGKKAKITSASGMGGLVGVEFDGGGVAMVQSSHVSLKFVPSGSEKIGQEQGMKAWVNVPTHVSHGEAVLIEESGGIDANGNPLMLVSIVGQPEKKLKIPKKALWLEPPCCTITTASFSITGKIFSWQKLYVNNPGNTSGIPATGTEVYVIGQGVTPTSLKVSAKQENGGKATSDIDVTWLSIKKPVPISPLPITGPQGQIVVPEYKKKPLGTVLYYEGSSTHHIDFDLMPGEKVTIVAGWKEHGQYSEIHPVLKDEHGKLHFAKSLYNFADVKPAKIQVVHGIHDYSPWQPIFVYNTASPLYGKTVVLVKQGSTAYEVVVMPTTGGKNVTLNGFTDLTQGKPFEVESLNAEPETKAALMDLSFGGLLWPGQTLLVTSGQIKFNNQSWKGKEVGLIGVEADVGGKYRIKYTTEFTGYGYKSSKLAKPQSFERTAVLKLKYEASDPYVHVGASMSIPKVPPGLPTVDAQSQLPVLAIGDLSLLDVDAEESNIIKWASLDAAVAPKIQKKEKLTPSDSMKAHHVFWNLRGDLHHLGGPKFNANIPFVRDGKEGVLVHPEKFEDLKGIVQKVKQQFEVWQPPQAYMNVVDKAIDWITARVQQRGTPVTHNGKQMIWFEEMSQTAIDAKKKQGLQIVSPSKAEKLKSEGKLTSKHFVATRDWTDIVLTGDGEYARSIDGLINRGVHLMAGYFLTSTGWVGGCKVLAGVEGAKVRASNRSFCEGVRGPLGEGKPHDIKLTEVGSQEVEVKIGLHSMTAQFEDSFTPDGGEGGQLIHFDWQDSNVSHGGVMRSRWMAQMLVRAFGPEVAQNIVWKTDGSWGPGSTGFSIGKRDGPVIGAAAANARIREIALAATWSTNLDLMASYDGIMDWATRAAVWHSKLYEDRAWAVSFVPGGFGRDLTNKLSEVKPKFTETNSVFTVEQLKADPKKWFKEAPLGVQFFPDEKKGNVLAEKPLGLPEPSDEVLDATIDKVQSGLQASAEIIIPFVPWAPGVKKRDSFDSIVKDRLWLGRRLTPAVPLPTIGLKPGDVGIIAGIEAKISPSNSPATFVCLTFPLGTMKPPAGKSIVKTTCNGLVDPTKADAISIPTYLLKNPPLVPYDDVKLFPWLPVGTAVELDENNEHAADVLNQIANNGGKPSGVVVGKAKNLVCVAFEGMETNTFKALTQKKHNTTFHDGQEQLEGQGLVLPTGSSVARCIDVNMLRVRKLPSPLADGK